MSLPTKHVRVADAAKLLSVCSLTVRNWIRAGHMKATKIGGAVLIPESEIARHCGLQEQVQTVTTAEKSGRILHKDMASRALASLLDRHGLHYVRADYHSAHKGSPTFVIYAASKVDRHIRGVAIWIKNEKLKPTNSQRSWESMFSQWGFKTMFVFDAREAGEGLNKLGVINSEVITAA